MNESMDLAKEFFKESKNQMKEIRKHLPDFIKDVSEGKKLIFEDNSDLFRAIHSVSGGSSFAGLTELEDVSWDLEKVVTKLFSGKIEPSSELAELIEKVVDLLEHAVKNSGKIKKREKKSLKEKLEKVLLEKNEGQKTKTKLTKKEKQEQDVPEKQHKPDKKQIDTYAPNRKAQKIEEKDSEEEEAPVNQYVSFKIGSECYAVPINYVYDMKEALPCSRIPNQPEHYLGVANLRGNIVPVVDFRSILGIKKPSFNEYTVFLMLKIKDKVKGCVVDAINDVVVLEPENTQTTPSVSRKTNIEFVNFIAKDPKSGQFLIVLDLEKILGDE